MELRPTLANKLQKLVGQEHVEKLMPYFIDHLQKILEVIARNPLASAQAAGLPVIPNHYDYHPGNLQWAAEEVVGIFDFDWAKMDLRLFDVGMIRRETEWTDGGLTKLRQQEQTWTMTASMLKATGVTKKFGQLTAVDNLSFEVKTGQIYGIAGSNGAGKSTVYNLITGFYGYEGKIEFDGRDITGLPPYRIAKAGIARTFQIPQTFPSLSVQKSIYVGSRFGARGGLDPAHVDEVIRFVDLEQERRQKTGLLNLLGKKKLMIGAALATKPKILMLDEPMAGCNATEIKNLVGLIRRINRNLGITIIIIEHFMKVLTELTEILLIIESGRMICCDAPAKVVKNPKVIECYLGKADAES